MADEIIIETTSSELVEVGVPGPQGPKGDTGDVGPAGPTIADANAPATNNILWQIRTTAFTAVSGGRYVCNGTFTVTNPATGNNGELFQVVVASGTVTVNGVAYGASRWPVTVARVSGAWTTLANTLTENLTLNGTNSTAPNQTAASGSSVMTRDLVDARTYWRGVAFYGASQTAADQANFFATTGENYFSIIAVPSKIELHIEVEFTTAPLAANPANFELRLGLRDVEAANLNTKINITRVAASSVTKISGYERYIIKGTIDTFPATWATRISTYGAAVVSDVGELFNLTGGSLTLTAQNNRVLYRVYL
jgi:hypothetical protein